MRFIKKDFLLISAILLTVISTVVILFYPDVVSYSYSYKALEEKKENIESINLTLNKNELELIEKRDSLKSVGEMDDDKHMEAVEVKRNIREEDFELDMPSFLISMEQRANRDSVELEIDYNSIRTIEGSENSEGTFEDEEIEGSGDDIDESNEGDSDEESDEPLFSEDEVRNGTVEIDGINVTVIPISLEGSYSSVRSYIKYLDEIGMIEPASVNLESEEQKVKGKVILNVFHGEVL